jgi:hypothetical protein
MGPRGYAQVFRFGWSGFTETPDRVVAEYASAGGLLQRLGVDGLVLGRREMHYAAALEKQGWEIAAQSCFGILLHRAGPRTPRVWSVTNVEWMGSLDDVLKRLAAANGPMPNLMVANKVAPARRSPVLAKAQISDVVEARLSVRCRVSNPSTNAPSVVAFARPYYPGYRAYLDDVEMPVEVLNGFQVGIVFPPGAKGVLSLRFLPESILFGCGLAVAGICVAGGFLVGPTLLGRRRTLP